MHSPLLAHLVVTGGPRVLCPRGTLEAPVGVASRRRMVSGDFSAWGGCGGGGGGLGMCDPDPGFLTAT